jgi:hypothetical protein
METTVSAVSLAIILGAPLAQNIGVSFRLIDNALSRLLLILWAGYAIRLSAFTGILAFLAVMTLITERNHEVLTTFPNQKPRWPSNSFGMPIAPPPLLGVKEEHAYEPPQYAHEDGVQGTDVADNKASDLHDNREDLPVPEQGSHAGSFFESKGLASTELRG